MWRWANCVEMAMELSKFKEGRAFGGRLPRRSWPGGLAGSQTCWFTVRRETLDGWGLSTGQVGSYLESCWLGLRVPIRSQRGMGLLQC